MLAKQKLNCARNSIIHIRRSPFYFYFIRKLLGNFWLPQFITRRGGQQRLIVGRANTLVEDNVATLRDLLDRLARLVVKLLVAWP